MQLEAQPPPLGRRNVTKRSMSTTKDKDPPSPDVLALTCLVVTLEERDPGFADQWVRHAEDDALHAEIRRLHSEAPNPALVANLQAAMALVRDVRFVAKSHARPVEAGRKRRKGRG